MHRVAAVLLLALASTLYPVRVTAQSSNGISANPGAVNIVTGTGQLGRWLGFDKDSGVHLGGAWIGNTGYLLSGGVEPQTWSFNSQLYVDLSLDLEKLVKIPGALFGIQFSQFNGQPTNDQAGVVAGYNGLPGPPPLNRSQLNQLWWRQRLFDDKLIVRVGKTVPVYDFNNVLRPLPLQDESLFVPSLSSLMYTPVFKNPTVIGAMPGSYNPAYGITLTFAPINNVYASFGIYDGNQARGEQTGLNVTPEFNGYYFMVGEAGYAWRLGSQGMPGTVAVGAWRQAGELAAGGVREDGAKGIYAFANQRLWLRHPGVDNSGVSGFFQFGVNDSDTMIVRQVRRRRPDRLRPGAGTPARLDGRRHRGVMAESAPRLPLERGDLTVVLRGARGRRHLSAGVSDARAEPGGQAPSSPRRRPSRCRPWFSSEAGQEPL